ncbi:ABC transporter permease [Pseudonocardia kujensis]|uniref:ABC transporter permease n=1 Tax=Pseudonocardia kujensis TaxID=1128675 RepID=UPI001E34DA24|nr:ABC transporter permease [Pseudonocardia kujensis]MCE0767440.1 ABC transporter permease [Pseudonocardia kujensis]
MTRTSMLNEWARRSLPTLAPLAALVAVIVVFSAIAPDTFPTLANVRNIAIQSSVLAILATGLTLVVVLGEIDLSFAAIASVSGLVASLVVSQTPFPLPFLGQVIVGAGNEVFAIIIAIAVGLMFGLINGLIVVRVGVPSFVATLSILLVAQGLAYYFAQGNSVAATTSIGRGIAQATWGPIPVIAVFAAAIMIISYLVLRHTRIGRYIYMAGANRQAAVLSGVPAGRIVVYVFVAAGVLFAIGGLVNVGRLGSAQADTGLNNLLPVFAIVVLGGNSLFGGVGGIRQTLVGVLLYSILQNGLDQSDLNVYMKPLVGGVILVLAVILNVYTGKIATAAATAGRGPRDESRNDAPKTSLETVGNP